jgi:maltose alpha-D-glucosyltransferase/alpha-amylase
MSVGVRMDSGDLWWKQSILYCLDVKTYFDSNDDGVGDFEGLINRIDHLSALGVSCIWLLPFYPSPDRDDGYDIADFYSINPRYGTIADFVAFIHAANERGIKVIIDLVANHTSDEHPWFVESRASRDSRKRDWYIWSDEPIEEATAIIFPGVQTTNWTLDEGTGQYYFHRFHYFQPDLNHSNREVREEIMQIMRYWLQLGVAGFRFDAAPFLIETVGVHDEPNKAHHEWLSDYAGFIQRRRGDSVLVGEVNLDPKEVLPYFGDGDEMHLVYNYSQNGALLASLATGEAQPLENHFSALPSIPEQCGWLNFARLHDELNLDRLDERRKKTVFEAFAPEEHMRIYGRGLRRRLPPMLDGDRRRLELAYSLTFATPGMPMLFYGEEIGMGDNLDLPDRLPARTVMQWSSADNGGFSGGETDDMVRPVATDPFGPKNVNVKDQRDDPDSFLHWMQRLIMTRKQSSAIGYGRVDVIDCGEPDVLVHRFEWETHLVLAVHNLSAEPRVLNLRRLAGERAHHLELEFADSSKWGVEPVLDEDVELPGYGYRWIRGFTRPTNNPLP